MTNYSLDKIDHLNLFSFLENTAKEFPERPAMAFVGEKYLLYKDFYKKVQRLAFHMKAHGIEFSDKVAIWGDNSPNWLIAYFATVSLGAVAVPILPDFAPLAVDNILDHSEAKILFISSNLYRKLKFDGTLKGKTIIQLQDFTMHRYQGGESPTEDDFEKFCKQHQKEIEKMEMPKISADDLASIIYTSGTTGTSKGVMLSHRNLVSNAIQGFNIFPIDENYRCLSILPMSHTLEFTLGNIYPVMTGASIHYLKKPPTASVLMPALKIVKPNLMLSVPLIMEKIFKSKIRPELTNSPLKRKLYSFAPTRKLLHRIAGKRLYGTFGGEMKFFGIGGAKLDYDVERFLIEAKFPYAIGYGLTETSPLLAGKIPFKGKIGSTGPAVDGVDLKLINQDPQTGEGEIIVYGPNIMKGYYKADELNKTVFTEDGGFRTGDTGVIDKDGFLFIKGRIKNMILGPSGENIFPEEIEAAINKSEWVLESLVYELKGKIIARVELNYEAIEKSIESIKDKASQLEGEVGEILTSIKESVNEEVNKFSRLNHIFEQKEPFIKTPTKKIKRYLYHEKEPHENPKSEE